MSKTAAVVALRPRRARPHWLGHPWVLVHNLSVVPDLADGTVVQLTDETGRPIDYGLWSRSSSLRVRLLGIGPEWPADWPHSALPPVFWRHRVEQAKRLRGALGLPNAETDAYRLLNADGDGTPGVIVDVYGELVVLNLTTAAAWAHRDALISSLVDVLSPRGIFVQVDAAHADKEGIAVQAGPAWGEVPAHIEVSEAGIRYGIVPGELQKTGHFLDQREHRVRFGQLASGRRVLDLHSFTGGFALHAARGGAESVVAVDSSEPAVELVRANAVRNGLGDRIEACRDKVERFLTGAAERGERWDLISLDPPKLAPHRDAVPKATKKVEALCGQAMSVLAPGGLLMVASCSHHIGPDELRDALSGAAAHQRRRANLVSVGHQPPDHPYPVALREGRYLTSVLAHIA